MPAAFDREYVKKLDGKHIKKGKTKYDLALQIKDDIADFRSEKRVLASRDCVVRFYGDIPDRKRCAFNARKVRGSNEGQSSLDLTVDAVRLGVDQQRRESCRSNRSPQHLLRASTS